MISSKDIKNMISVGLTKKDVKPGDVVLVHSSLKSLSANRIEAKDVIEALLNHLTEEGTLLMPALSYMTVNENNPEFSINDTPSCVGKLTEVFRTKPGILRSLHPTHSVCAKGKYAKEITKFHFKDTTPVGKHSPFSLLPEYDGKLLFLGCGLRPNTSMHGVEELVNAPYTLKPTKTKFIVKDAFGKTSEVLHHTHNFDGYVQRYDRLVSFLNDKDYKKGKIMDAECFVINSKALWEKGAEALKLDPFVFVDKL